MSLASLIPVGAWLWDKYGKSLTDKTAGTIKSQWAKFRWSDAADAYRAKIKKLYGTMQIVGMAEPMPLDHIFTEVYLLDKPTALSRFDIEGLKQMSAADRGAPPANAERIGGLTLVKRNDNLFILGTPGAGKTTFLKYIALKAVEQLIDKIPLFVPLKQWADSGMELMPFIAERFEICDFPDAQPFVEELLKSGNAIVLFDGLDEVNQNSGQRDLQVRAMNNFVGKYDRTQCLITCRIAASDYSFERFTYVEIADFTDKQIRIFVSNWFRNNEGQKDTEICNKFLTEFEKDQNWGLRDMARTPLLLTLLCLSFNETLTFPQRRIEIYEEALDALLRKWDSSRGVRRDEIYRKLSRTHKENILARIAIETFELNEYFIAQPELERLITNYVNAHVKDAHQHGADLAADGEIILKAIEAQHGILVERAREVYSFSHLTFQEYFTAKYIVANADKGTLNRLVKIHCADERWREVFLLTTSLLTDAGKFMITFRRGVEDTLQGNEQLKALLEWADKRSTSIQYEPWLARPNYLLVETRDRSKNPELSHALGLAVSRDHALSRLLNGLFDGIPNSVRDISLIFNLNRALDLANARKLQSELHLKLELELVMAKAGIQAKAMGLSKLEEELDGLSEGARETPAEVGSFADKLRALTIEYKGVGREWSLTKTEETLLANYLRATSLLHDCLDLASMPLDQKSAILNSLYLPPASAVANESARDGF